MAGGFKRSGRFGLIGVFVVVAIVIVIATTTGQGEANPKTTMALIFGVIAVFCRAPTCTGPHGRPPKEDVRSRTR